VILRAAILATVFLAGAALMSLEMAGFRLITPEFGSDIEVWGSIISVFLGGMALGAIIGGRLADRWPSLTLLGLILLVAGAVTLLMPLVAQPIMDWAYPGQGAPLPMEWGGGGSITTYQAPSLRWPALLAGTLLFGLPSILLGMISPYSARLFVHELGHMGAGVGEVYGVSTIGSIIGTLGTTFYLITWMGTTWLLLTNGLVLAGLAVALLAGGQIRGESIRAAWRGRGRPLLPSGQPRPACRSGRPEVLSTGGKS
jgi:MFS family permease